MFANLNQYYLPFIFSFIIAIILTPLVKNFLVKKNLAMSVPRERDIHKKPIPRLGGIAIFLSFLIVVIGYLIFKPEDLSFVSQKFLGFDRNLIGLVLGAVILFTVGVVDDIRGVNAWQKLFWQIIAGVVVVYFGINVWWLANPLGGVNIEMGFWTYIFVPMWIVLIVNVMNWLDGIDGLASGISGITLVVLMILSATPLVNQPATALLAAILAGGIFGFLPYNFNPAKIFLGDSGSMFLGFIIAVGAIISGGKIATVALVLGIPILDALWVIMRRLISGKSIIEADKFHLHHRFLEAGFSQKQTVLILYAISVLFGIIALEAGTKGKFTAGLWLLAIMVIIGLVLFFMKKKIKKERNV